MASVLGNFSFRSSIEDKIRRQQGRFKLVEDDSELRATFVEIKIWTSVLRYVQFETSNNSKHVLKIDNFSG